MRVFMSNEAILFVCRRQKTVQVDATVFTCISMLARAMGPGIQQDIKELLEPMLAVGLRCVPEACGQPASVMGLAQRTGGGRLFVY